MKLKFSLFTFLISFGIIAQDIEAPEISMESGFYETGFDVEITHEDEDVMILYSLDGSVPQLENKTGKVWKYIDQYRTYPSDSIHPGEFQADTIWTFEYNAPISIQQLSDSASRIAKIPTSYYQNNNFISGNNVNSSVNFRGTTLRAIAYKDGEYSEPVTRNYFITPEAENKYSFPIACVSIDPDLLFDFEIGQNVPGKIFETWRDSSAFAFPDIYTDANFRQRGDTSEMKIHFTYLEKNYPVVSQNAGMRIHGKASRVYPNRSFRLYARSDYGKKNFKHAFFPNYETEKFKRLILRSSGQDTERTMFRDAFAQTSTKKLNTEYQEYQPVILFINGEYWGIYNLRERYDKKYFKIEYGIEADEDELDFFKDFSVKYGDSIAMYQLLGFLEGNDLTDDSNYEYVKEHIDLENFKDYFITEIFASNFDWPKNNMTFWRKRVDYEPDAAYGHDGRWRWMLQDLDFTTGFSWVNNPNNFNDLEKVTTLSYTDTMLNQVTLVLRRLLENEEFQHNYINRFADVLNSSFKKEVMTSKIEEMEATIAPEIREHTARWTDINNGFFLNRHPVKDSTYWAGYVQEMKNFVNERPYWVRQHIQERFDAGKQLNVIVGISDEEHGEVKINTLSINEELEGINANGPYPWSGIYYENVPITLTATAKPGYMFSHWSGERNDTIPSIQMDLENDTYVKANFVPEDEDEDEDDSSVQETEKASLEVYPNPFHDKINVLANSYQGQYRILSIMGSIVQEGKFNSPVISTANLTTGIYVLEIQNGEKTYRNKLVKK